MKAPSSSGVAPPRRWAATEGTVHAYFAFAAAAILAELHGAYVLHALYLAPNGVVRASVAVSVSGVAIAALGARTATRRGRTADNRLAASLLAASVSAIASGFLPFLTFASGSRGVWTALGCLAVSSATGTLAAHDLWLTVGRASTALGLTTYVTRPLRIVLLFSLLGAAGVVGAHAGFLRAELGAAALLLAAALALGPIRAFLEGAPPIPRALERAATVAVALGIAACAARASRFVPFDEVSAFPDDVVHARGATDGTSHRYVVIAAPGGYELFRDRSLAVASLDEHRAAAALARPVLSHVKKPARVLLLDGGTGVLERELLRDPRVEALTVVVEDPELVPLSRGMPWLARRANGAFDSPRARFVVAEPIVWLAASDALYDVIVANLAPPFGYREGKYYTRYFFSALAAHLTEGGSFVVPAASAFASRDTFDIVLATAASIGLPLVPYHAALPTLGVASYVIVSKTPFDEPLDASGVAIDVGKDLAAHTTTQVATLFDQRVVDAFDAHTGRSEPSDVVVSP
ncbi:MAG TPA: hypothetical protein VH142_13465 [Polyangiaceae bacterium]|nr:hypothetical protein [Polyangiaceae bacterium]